MKYRLTWVLALTLMMVVSTSFGGTISVTNGTSVDPEQYDASRFLIRAGNPTAQEIQDFKDGNLDLIRFTSTTQVLEDAETDLDFCSAAVTLVCGTLSETPRACSVTPSQRCVGVCLNNVRIKIVD